MTNHWGRVGELFDAARALPLDERDTWLRDNCADARVTAEVRGLLKAYEEDPGFLERPVAIAVANAALDAAVAPSPEGRQLGPYRLVREVGRGGMGVVYEAEHSDAEFSRRVAVKLVPSGWSATSLVARFRYERRVLARLDHPGIARLLDARTTDEGTPYFVMEYVDGQPIDAWCRERALPVRQKIELALKVFEAVEHAHRSLVVHRDLKAANILVTSEGQPKLLDFGIATMLSEEAESAGGATATGLAFTPAYASPEQVRGEGVTTASDVYSLGVLLYLLLVDRLPYDVTGLSAFEAMRAVCEAEPPVPSTLAPPATRRILRGDLDNIVLLALRKDARARYASVGAFAADLQAWLDGLPVMASQPTLWYRARKLVVRRKVAAAATAAMSLTIIGGVSVSLHQTRIATRQRAVAQQRYEMVRQLADAVIGEFGDALQGAPESIASRKRIVAHAIQYLDSLSQQPEADAGLLRQLASSYVRIGAIQGDPARPNLGDAAGALTSYERALGLYARLATFDTSPASRSGEAEARGAIGQHYWSHGNIELALQHFQDMRRLFEALSSEDPGQPVYRRGAAKAHYLIGQGWLRGGDPLKALESFKRSAAGYEALLTASPGDAIAQRSLPRAYIKLGDTAADLGDWPAELTWYRRAVDRLEALGRSDRGPETPRLTAFVWLRIAEGQLETNPAAAEEAAGRAVRIVQPVAQRDPTNIQAHFDLGYAQRIWGQALARQGRRNEQGSALSASVGELRLVVAKDAQFADARRELGISLRCLGDVAASRREYEAALSAYRESLLLLESTGPTDRGDEELAWLYKGLGEIRASRPHGEGEADASAESAGTWFRKSARQWMLLAKRRGLTEPEAVIQREVERRAAAHDRGASDRQGRSPPLRKRRSRGAGRDARRRIVESDRIRERRAGRSRVVISSRPDAQGLTTGSSTKLALSGE